MQQKFPFQTLLVIILALIPVGYLAYIYQSLPTTVPTHFDLSWKADAYGPKSTIWFPILLISALIIGMHFLFKVLPKIDPKKSANQSPVMLGKLSVFLAVFMALIEISIIQATAGNTAILDKTLIPALGLLFALIGNYMYSVKPNYFVGLRIPWTLENEYNWRKTHQYMSKFWVVGGLLILIIGLLTNLATGLIIMFCILFVITILPIIYSYKLFKQENSSHENI
ncbi:MAG: hypothetical protein RL596_1074 [Bacteroidota bacterium]|jgi:uncharacterized membrane protein